MVNSHDYVPLLMSDLDVPVGLDQLLQRIASTFAVLQTPVNLAP